MSLGSFIVGGIFAVLVISTWPLPKEIVENTIIPTITEIISKVQLLI